MALARRTKAALTAAAAVLVGGIGVPASASPGGNGPLAITLPDPTNRQATQAWTVNPDGSQLRRAFAAIDEENNIPVWSPDGRWIAFNRAGALLVARPDGTDARVVSRAGGPDVSWSPDGSQLVYGVRDRGQHGEIWVVNADGTDAHMIHEGPSVEAPAWSPRGDAIAFTRQKVGAPAADNDPEIYVMDPDGGNLTALTDNYDPANPDLSLDYMPAWSPDGSKIVFVSYRDQAPGCFRCDNDLYVMDADGSDVIRLPHDGMEFFPSWSPDGTSVAFVAMPRPPFSGPMHVDVMEIATGAARHVTEVRSSLATVDWGVQPGSTPLADLNAQISTSTLATQAGSDVTYFARVANRGGSTAVGAAVTIRMAPGSVLDVPAPAGCTGQHVVRCSLGDLPPGGSATVAVTGSGGAAGVPEISALATSTTPDPNVLDNRHAASLALCTRIGTDGADSLRGTGGNDVICGAAGDDRIRGGAGNDVLVGGRGNDKVSGGRGADTTSYATSSRKVSVSLDEKRAKGDGTDKLVGVENADGSRFNDRLAGSGKKNVLGGRGGRDRLSGGDGSDVLLGGADADRLVPGAGGDRLDGGLGVDLVDYRSAGRAVTADLRRQQAKGQGDDVLAALEGAIGSRFGDELVGSVVSNRLVGGGGADEFSAAGGNDKVSGGAGEDELRGGDGNDRLAGGPGSDRCKQNFGGGRKKQCER